MADMVMADMVMADMHRGSWLLLRLSMPILPVLGMAIEFSRDVLILMGTHNPASALD